MPQRSVLRIIQVTVGLSVLGTVVGGILGAGLVALVGVRIGDVRISGEVLYTGTVFGALIGCVLAPLAAWTLMRRVPIWRAIVETAIGTVAGTVIGLTFQPLRDTAWLSPSLLGVGGFALAAIRLRLPRRARRSEITPRAG
jgi:hypothetical protein